MPLHRTLILVATLIALAAPALHSQATAPRAATPAQPISAGAGSIKPILFEVVSIRLSMPTRINGDYFTDDGFTIHGITPQTLLTYMSKRLIGVPDWCFNERYDVVAKVAEADVPIWKAMNFKQRSLAIGPMLEGRFKLKWHMEARMEAGYELVIAKDGSKVKEPTAAELDLRAKDPTPGHAVLFSGSRGGGYKVVGQASSMDLLTYYLQEFFTRAPVVDKTGLPLTYDFALDAAPLPDLTAPGSDPPVSDGASLFPAIQQQLGLRLVAAKVPVQYVVVDHIERPAAN
jgi:uncharacterized protein (TIGR03435 family)